MTVELLYFEGCPHYEPLAGMLRQLIDELAPGAELRFHRVETIEDAERERFLGSPTVRIDGADVEPGSADREDFGLECRLYRESDTISPLPPERWIREAMERGTAPADS